MRPDEQGSDEYVLTPEQEDRSVALAVARDLLLVKGGKYAERPLEPSHLIHLARWILDGDERSVSWTFEGHEVPRTPGFAQAVAQAIQDHNCHHGMRS